MQKTKLSPKFGLKITGFNIAEARRDDLDEILTELEKNSLLLFPQQALDDKELYEFSKSLGNLEESARKISHSPHYKKVSYLTNLRDGEGQPLGFGGMDTDFWHSDQEFRENPATLASLYCIVPSQTGGTTSFASTVLSNLNLSKQVIDKAHKLLGIYVPASTHDNVDKIEVAHPLLLTSPSGKQSVYVSENTQSFIGLSCEEGECLKKQLLETILQLENIYSHQWKVGDFILYDNTQLLHRRDKFSGIRWLKATKIFAPKNRFAIPSGVTYHSLSASSFRDKEALA